MRTAFLWIGALLFAAGLVMGFAPQGSEGTDCGSAFKPHHENDFFPPPGDCDAVRSHARTGALTFTLVGGAVILVELAVRAQASSREHRTVLGRPVRRADDPGEQS